MSMSRKDYVMLSQVIGGAWGEMVARFAQGPNLESFNPEWDAVVHDAYWAFDTLVSRLCGELQQDNQAFDGRKFRKAVRDYRDAAERRNLSIEQMFVASGAWEKNVPSVTRSTGG